MPGLDKTGPFGEGSMTGRGMGPCGGGRRCYGYGWRRFYNKDEEREMIKQDIEELEKELKAAKEYLANLKD